MQELKRGDVVTLAHPRMRPKYLNGARVEVTGIDARSSTFSGTIVSMLQQRGHRFREGTQIISVPQFMVEQPVTA